MALNVLLADKSFVARSLFKEVIHEKFDITLTEVDNSYAALEKIHTEKFDLVIFDAQLPQINGVVLLKKTDPALPVILLSYCDELFYKKHPPRENLLGCLQKPVNLSEFNALLKKGGFS